MRTSSEKSKFIKAIKETPNMSLVCKKLDISRSNVYRWREKDAKFRKELNKALTEGRENWIDVAELSLFKKIKDYDMRAISFFLSHNSKMYHKKSEVLFIKTQEELKPGEACEHCGQEKPAQKTEKSKKFMEEMALGYLERKNRLRNEEREKEFGPQSSRPLHIKKQTM